MSNRVPHYSLRDIERTLIGQLSFAPHEAFRRQLRIVHERPWSLGEAVLLPAQPRRLRRDWGKAYLVGFLVGLGGSGFSTNILVEKPEPLEAHG